jgi:hypothetical protein
MNIRDVFSAYKLRYEIAAQVVLKTWQPEAPEPMQCPRCKCQKFSTRRQKKGVQYYRCHQCDYHFKKPTLIDCDCPTPGSQPKCQACPSYKTFVVQFAEQLDALNGLNTEELQTLLLNRSSILPR